jgi:hypothetical protein
MWKYKNDEGATITISDDNHKSMLEREGFKLVGEVDEKGKLIKA